MKRWDIKKSEYVESARMDSFLSEIHELCKKHGFCIEHEDTHGAFVVEQYNDDKDFEWLDNANIGESIKEL